MIYLSEPTNCMINKATRKLLTTFRAGMKMRLKVTANNIIFWLKTDLNFKMLTKKSSKNNNRDSMLREFNKPSIK